MTDGRQPVNPDAAAFRWEHPAKGTAPGTKLGDYTIVGKLGEGGMGVVFRAQDPSGREVALKLLPSGSKAMASDRLKREAEITASLKHPGIVGIHTAGEVDGQFFIAYELVEGLTLQARLESLGRDEALEIVVQVAQALAYAHERGVIHRDLKPENILLDKNDRPRVADFGLALAADVERLTRSGALLGTPRAMAPEQAAGDRDRYGPHTDVWALGVLLYRVLTGENPFNGPTLVELLAQISSGTFKRPRELDPSISPAFAAVCVKALNTEPSRRYSNAGAFVAALVDARSEKSFGTSRGPLVIAALLALGTLGGWALSSSEAPAAQTDARLSSSPHAKQPASLKQQRDSKRDVAHQDAMRKALVGLGAERADDVARALKTFALAGPPASRADHADVVEQVVVRAHQLLDTNVEASLTLLEGLASTDLQLQARRPGALLVSTAFAKATFGSLSDSDYGRLILCAAQLDLPMDGKHVRRFAETPRRLPGLTRKTKPWVDFLALWASYHGTRKSNRGLISSFMAILFTDPPSPPLGPCLWADTASEVAQHLDDHAATDALLGKAAVRDPANPYVQLAYSLTLRKRGLRTQALKRALKARDLFALRTNPKSDPALNRKFLNPLFRLYIELDMRPEARAHWAHVAGTPGRAARILLEQNPWVAEKP